MAHQQGTTPYPPPPPPDYWTQGTTINNNCPNPPVLSFRAFHATHFSWSQRQAFFGGGAPTPFHRPYNFPPPPPLTSAYPVVTDTFAADCPPQAYTPQYQYPSPPPLKNEYATVDDRHNDDRRHDNTIGAVTTEHEDEGAEGPVVAGAAHGLTQEAIEIFEFSRRFREAKAAALEQERVRMTRRRHKRRRLAKRGFAPDEGNSGSDDDPVKDFDGHQDNCSDNDGAEEEEDDEGGGSGEDDGDDEFMVQIERPATDITFLTQPSRRREMARQKLYGIKAKNTMTTTTTDKATADVVPSSTSQLRSAQSDSSTAKTMKTQAANGMWSIRMLEEMLNQTYIDSLALDSASSSSSSTAAPQVQTGRRRSREFSRGSSSRSQQQNQVVYWPGMPLRC